MAEPTPMPASAGRDGLRARAAIDRFHALQAAAARAPLGSPAFRSALDELRRVREELLAAGIDPHESWREQTQRRLGLRVRPQRPGRKARLRSARA